MNICPKCGIENDISHNYCYRCGGVLQLSRRCPYCGTESEAPQNFCGSCGSRLSADVASSASAAPRESSAIPVSAALRHLWDGLDNRLSRAQAALRLANHNNLHIPLMQEVVLVAALTLVALFLRVNNLADIPPGTQGDEANYAFEVQRVLEEGWIGIWTPASLGAPAGPLYIAAPFFLLGGHSIEMLRFATAILGVALVPIAYILIRQLFGVRIGLSAAIMLTFSVWFVTQSRIGWDPLHCVFFQILTFCLLIAGMRRDRAWIVIAAGLVFGLSLYFYKATLIYFVLGWATILGLLIVSREFRRKHAIYWFLGISIIVGAPMLLHYFTQFDIAEKASSSYSASTSMSFDAQVARLRRAWDVLMFVHNPVDVGSEGAGGTPILLSYLTRAIFWVGLATSLLFINKRHYQLAVIGWLISMAPAILVPGMEPRRYLLGILYLYLFASIGLSASAALFLNLLPIRSVYYTRVAPVAVSLVVVAVFAATNLRAFDDYLKQRAGWYMSHSLVEACEYVQPLGNSYEVRMYSGRWSYDYSSCRWLLPDARGINGSVEFGGDGTAMSGGELNGNTVFLLLGGYLNARLQGEIEAAHPNGRWHTQADDNGEALFAAYVIDES